MGDILTGMFFYVLYKTVGVPEEYEKMLQERKTACGECPLKKENFCSSKYAVKLYPENEGENLAVRLTIKSIKAGSRLVYIGKVAYKRGCGCFLPFKQLSVSKCPLDKW